MPGSFDMPIYEYKCAACEKVTEVLQKLNDPPPPSCPHCGEKDCMKKQVTAASIELKGGGWFADGY